MDSSILKDATTLNLEEIARCCGNAPYVLRLASLPEAGDGDARLVLHGDAKVKDVNCPICYFKLEGKKEWRCLPFGDRVSLSVLNDKVDAAATITVFPDSGFSIVSVPAKMVDIFDESLGVFANVQALWGCGA